MWSLETLADLNEVPGEDAQVAYQRCGILVLGNLPYKSNRAVQVCDESQEIVYEVDE